MPQQADDSSKSTGEPIGIGPTTELSLRVSVASLARVVFPSPEDGTPMLALEHKATLLPGEESVVVKAQPFGGAVQILNLHALQSGIGSFHFDSEKSRSEQDFRIFIQPSEWDVVQAFCLRDFSQERDSILEADPVRELVEEFRDAMGIKLKPDQYEVKWVETVLENEPMRTRNVHTADWPTVRIYRVFEAQILDPALCRAMLINTGDYSSNVLWSLALDDARMGGPGRANAMKVVSMKRIRDAYLTLSPDKRGKPLSFENTHLDGNVPAVLEGITVSRYQRVRLSHDR